jgi:hypothetical protein
MPVVDLIKTVAAARGAAALRRSRQDPAEAGHYRGGARKIPGVSAFRSTLSAVANVGQRKSFGGSSNRENAGNQESAGPNINPSTRATATARNHPQRHTVTARAVLV